VRGRDHLDAHVVGGDDEDVSVVGFDDLPIARWVSPPLTTIRQPLIEMAEAAAELVVGLARGEEPPQMRVELATELIVRESTAPPASLGDGERARS
jgi:LacI family xylobiose transport system transcriptional regulator